MKPDTWKEFYYLGSIKMILDKSNLKENTVHGSADFPLCVYKSLPNHDENVLFSHWHDEMEIFYLASGKATLYLDTVPVGISEGEAVIINRGVIHSGYSEDFSNCVFYAVVFDLSMLYSNKTGDALSKYLVPICQKQYALPVKISGDSDISRHILEELLKIVDAYIGKRAAYQLSILSSLYSILNDLITDNRIVPGTDIASNPAKAQLQQFRTVLSFIDENYGRKLEIHEMAEQAGMSPYHFCRFFKLMAGKTPFEYLIGYRIYQAELQLRDPGKRILDIALDVGFNNFSYFIKCFKEYKKMTPGRYRRLVSNTDRK
jgi:AraC-like DNA-binding protein